MITTCDGPELTGLTVEELWARHCYLHEYKDGNRVTFRFETISRPELERIAQIQAIGGDGIHDYVDPVDDHDLGVDGSANLYLPRATIDLNDVYVHVYVTCDRIDETNEVSYLLTRPVTEFVDPIALRNAAEARLVIPDPTPASNPPIGDPDHFGIVHIPTWFWVEDTWATIGPEEEIDGPAAVAVAAVPTLIAWDPGDGSEPVECRGPGVEWASGMSEDDTYCSHTYTKSSAGVGSGSAYELTATVEWTLVWWINGSYLGPYDTYAPSTSTAYQVGEIHAVEVDNP